MVYISSFVLPYSNFLIYVSPSPQNQLDKAGQNLQELIIVPTSGLYPTRNDRSRQRRPGLNFFGSFSPATVVTMLATLAVLDMLLGTGDINFVTWQLYYCSMESMMAWIAPIVNHIWQLSHCPIALNGDINSTTFSVTWTCSSRVSCLLWLWHSSLKCKNSCQNSKVLQRKENKKFFLCVVYIQTIQNFTELTNLYKLKFSNIWYQLKDLITSNPYPSLHPPPTSPFWWRI